MSSDRTLPQHKPTLLSREIDGEFVVVDEASGQAHQLSGPVAEVWRAIESRTSPALPQAEVDALVAELSALGLLVEPQGMTRRLMLQRSGAVVAATGLATIALPQVAAHASSGVVTTTTLTLASANTVAGGTYAVSGTVKRASGGTNVPSGTVSIVTAGTTSSMGSGTVSDGVYNFVVQAPAEGGTYSIQASYEGDATYAASQSPSTTITVASGPKLTSVAFGGTTPGLLQAGDTLVLGFDTGVTNALASYTVSEKRVGTQTLLSIPGLINDVSINASYVSAQSGASAPATCQTSSNKRTLTLTVGVLTGAANLGTGTGAATLTPSANLKDNTGAAASQATSVPVARVF